MVGYCDCGVCGDCNAIDLFFFLLNEVWLKIWVRAGDSYSYEGVSAGIWVIYTGAKSGGELVTLFGNIFSLFG